MILLSWFIVMEIFANLLTPSGFEPSGRSSWRHACLRGVLGFGLLLLAADLDRLDAL
jgi:hypothetical protein